MRVWTFKCIDYDSRFHVEIYERYPNWTPPDISKSKQKKIKPKPEIKEEADVKVKVEEDQKPKTKSPLVQRPERARKTVACCDTQERK